MDFAAKWWTDKQTLGCGEGWAAQPDQVCKLSLYIYLFVSAFPSLSVSFHGCWSWSAKLLQQRAKFIFKLSNNSSLPLLLSSKANSHLKVSDSGCKRGIRSCAACLLCAAFALPAEMCCIRNPHHRPVCCALTHVTAHILLSCVSGWCDTHSLGRGVTAEHEPPYMSESGEKLM